MAEKTTTYKIGDIDENGRSLVLILKDGRHIWQKDEDDIATDFALTSTVFKGKSNEVDISATTRQMMFGLFEIDDSPLVLDNLEGTPRTNEKAIGSRAFTRLSQLAGEFAKGSPDPKP